MRLTHLYVDTPLDGTNGIALLVGEQGHSSDLMAQW